MRYKPHKKNLITPEALKKLSAKEIQEKFKVSQATSYRWLAEAERRNDETNNNR